MAAKKTTPKTDKDSKFYVAKTITQAREKIEKKVKTVNEKYVKKQIESGREFLTELKSDPVKRIDDLIDDSRTALKKAREEKAEALQKRVDLTKADMRKKIEKLSKETQKVYEGIGHDARLILDDVIEKGKKNLDKLPIKKTLEEKINAGIDAIPSKLNLPSKNDIENLVCGIDGVNKKVDALNKEFAKA